MNAKRDEGKDPRAGLLRWLEQEAARFHPLAVTGVALLVGRLPQDLVRDAQRAHATAHLPPDLRLQAHLRHVVGVVSMAARHRASLRDALDWYRTACLPGADRRTPEDLTAEGHAANACRNLALHAANDDQLAAVTEPC